MHKRIWNSLRLEFTITPKEAPLLIKSGTLSPNPSLPDMQFVRTMTAKGETIFIPGSSLKGVFRSFTEKVLRTLNSEKGACDPFGDNACGDRLAKEEDTAKVYHNSCLTCKIYGNTRLRGRIAFADAFPNGELKTETRYGVAISRLTNAVAHGPFDIEIVVAGDFKGSLMLENFEVWQLGLLALTIQAINHGLVKIGFGKNRGFGQVNFKVTKATLDLAKVNAGIPSNEIWGVGQFVKDDERKNYGLHDDDKLTGLPSPSEVDLAVFVRRIYDAKGWEYVAEKAIKHLSTALEVG